MNRQWTTKDLGEIAAFAAQGMSAAQIACRADCTRNAIIGLCSRQGIKLLGKGGVPVGYKWVARAPRIRRPKDEKIVKTAPRTIYKPSRILMFAGLH